MKSIDSIFEEEGTTEEANFAEDQIEIGLEKGVCDYFVAMDEGNNIWLHLLDDFHFLCKSGIVGIFFGICGVETVQQKFISDHHF